MGNAILLVRMKTLILLIAVFQAMGDANGNPGETFKQNSSNIERSFYIYNFKFPHAFETNFKTLKFIFGKSESKFYVPSES